MERGANTNGIYTVRWYLNNQLITEKFSISYLRIRRGTGNTKAKKKKKRNLVTYERNFIVTSC